MERESGFSHLAQRPSEREDQSLRNAAAHCLNAVWLIAKGSGIRHFSLPGLSGQRCQDTDCARLVSVGEGSVCRDCLCEILIATAEGLIRAGSEICDPDDGQLTGG